MRHFDFELRDLKFGILSMAGQVEEMITLTEQALLERSNAKAERVSELDRNVDAAELKMDQVCIDLLALRAPFASDLRLLASSLKIVPELERIGDHCCNIARRAMVLNIQPPVPLGDALTRLGSATHAMVRQAVDAFLNGDAALAQAVIMADDQVDELYVQLFKELLRGMLADPLCIERSSHLIIVIKNWERIADQATNIAEEVLFILEGVSVKHRHLQGPGSRSGA
ncbi:MAG: phosphate signaling complex protein PhoU [Holophaga sp.]|nr:phosphate signaling complex protein PhoU [Holophaga sp.]